MLPTVRLQPPPLYFMHIPKTAGTALQALLRSIYGHQYFVHIPIRQLYLYEPDQLSSFRCWQSHYGSGLLPFLPQQDLRCITMVRQPVEQVISYIYFKRKNMMTKLAHHHPTDQVQIAPLVHADLRTWLADPSSTCFDNFQTRWLGTVLDIAPWFKSKTADVLQQHALFPQLLALPTDDHKLDQLFQRACQQLEKLAVVGITERFAESLQLICALLGVPLPTQMPSANLGPTKTQVQIDAHRQQTPPDLVEQVEARNCYDRMLYDYACELFAAQLAHHRAHTHRTISLAPQLRATKQRWQMLGKSVLTRKLSRTVG